MIASIYYSINLKEIEYSKIGKKDGDGDVK
jgi:hypothetical protein